MRFWLFAGFCGVLFADSKAEADLARRLASSESARADLIRANADLSRRLAVSQALAQAAATAAANAARAAALTSDRVKAQSQTPAEKNAITQAQSESSQTLTNTDASVRAETEFEKQLTRIEKNLIKLIWGMIILVVLIMCFVGVIVYAPRRRDKVPALPIQVGEA